MSFINLLENRLQLESNQLPPLRNPKPAYTPDCFKAARFQCAMESFRWGRQYVPSFRKRAHHYSLELSIAVAPLLTF